jgi:uncharacterized RDD family membrane protein YckC
MQVILDQPTVEQDPSKVKYAGFWIRFGALILDGLILTPVSLGVSYFNITEWKSLPVFLLISMLGIAYKPLMETLYGATLGKMAVKIKVTNLRLDPANMQTILLRNIFNIIPSLLTMFLSISMYTDPDFESISGYQEFVAFSQQYAGQQFISGISGLLAIVDAIMLAADGQSRSLHDRIAGTYVIQRPE